MSGLQLTKLNHHWASCTPRSVKFPQIRLLTGWAYRTCSRLFEHKTSHVMYFVTPNGFAFLRLMFLLVYQFIADAHTFFCIWKSLSNNYNLSFKSCLLLVLQNVCTSIPCVFAFEVSVWSGLVLSDFVLSDIDIINMTLSTVLLPLKF